MGREIMRTENARPTIDLDFYGFVEIDTSEKVIVFAQAITTDRKPENTRSYRVHRSQRGANAAILARDGVMLVEKPGGFFMLESAGECEDMDYFDI